MLEVVTTGERRDVKVPQSQAYEDHKRLIESYFNSYKVRNFSKKTISQEKSFLVNWFEDIGSDERMFYTWEAMEPVKGRERIVEYGNSIAEHLKSDTVRSYIGILRRYFSYVLEHPYIIRKDGPQRINLIYNPIEQPVSEYDIPKHSYGGEKLGIPLDPEKLYEFYGILRKHYLSSGCRTMRARNYAMAVVAGESGLRAEEIIHLELCDLFFESKKIQTRYAKATRGSGKRSRVTLFTPLTRDTIRYYLKEHRKKLLKGAKTNFLFPSKNGILMTYPSIQKALQEMVEIAQKQKFQILKHMGWHWYRRIFATRFIERFPGKLSVLMELLGHSNLSTIHRYIRHSEAWMDRQIQKTIEGVENWPFPGD